MKNILLLIISLTISVCGIAQEFSLISGSAIVSPDPLAPVEQNGTGTFTFMSVATGGDILIAADPMQMTSSLSNVELIDGVNSVSGYEPYFLAVEFFASGSQQVAFLQIAVIPDGTMLTIQFEIKVVVNTFIGNRNNGANVNVTPGTAQIVGDDYEEYYTYVEETTPVELIFFSAERKGKTAVLSWETATEINNDYFDIERSADGVVFEAIGRMDGNGTTTEKHKYEFMDDVPKSGINYYRLNQVDYDGKRDYTPIRSVKFGDIREDVNLKMNYSPNPVSDYLSITSNGDLENHTVRILDMTGKLIVRYDYIAGMIVPMYSFVEGIYSIQIVDADGHLVSTDRIVKHNG